MRRLWTLMSGALLVLALGGVASAGTFGPDDFGYLGADQAEEGVTYEWVDMSDGTMLTPLGDDEMTAAIPLGFEFVFYGQTFTELKVMTNGIVAFTPPIEYDIFGGTQCPLPMPNDLNGIVAVFERDLNPDDAACGAGCWIGWEAGGEEPNRWFGVTFNAVPVFRESATEDADPITAQVIFYEGANTVVIQVQESGAAGGGDATVGIEAPDGIAGLAGPPCMTDGAVADESAYVFTPPDGGTPVVPPVRATYEQPGATVEYSFLVFNLEEAAVTFDAAVTGNTWTSALSDQTVAVDAGGSSELTLSVDVPGDAEGGAADEATITLTPQGGGDAVTATALTLVQDTPDEWQVASHLPYVVDNPFVAVHGDDIWMFGGEVWDELALSKPITDVVQVLDTETMTWSNSVDDGILAMPDVRANAASCIIDDRVYIAGGFTTDSENPLGTQLFIYDISDNEWTDGAALPEGRAYHALVCDATNGAVYLLGGFAPPEEGGETYLEANTLWRYDVASDSWDQSLATMPTTRSFHSAALVDGEIVVAGGFVHDYLDKRSDVYDIADDTWSRTGDLSVERLLHGTALLDGERMCLVGGSSFDALMEDTFECYSNGYWIPQIALLGVARTFVTGATVGTMMYAIGGAETDSPFQPTQYTPYDLVERYPTAELPEPPVDEGGADVAQPADGGGTQDVVQPEEVIDPQQDTVTPPLDTGGPQEDTGGSTADSGAATTDTGGGSSSGGGGGGCTTGGPNPVAPLTLLLLVGLLVLRRRKA